MFRMRWRLADQTRLPKAAEYRARVAESRQMCPVQSRLSPATATWPAGSGAILRREEGRAGEGSDASWMLWAPRGRPKSSGDGALHWPGEVLTQAGDQSQEPALVNAFIPSTLIPLARSLSLAGYHDARYHLLPPRTPALPLRRTAPDSRFARLQFRPLDFRATHLSIPATSRPHHVADG